MSGAVSSCAASEAMRGVGDEIQRPDRLVTRLRDTTLVTFGIGPVLDLT